MTSTQHEEEPIPEWADRILRASVPERWKGCTSAIGSVQSYIAELEQSCSEPERLDASAKDRSIIKSLQTHILALHPDPDPEQQPLWSTLISARDRLRELAKPASASFDAEMFRLSKMAATGVGNLDPSTWPSDPLKEGEAYIAKELANPDREWPWSYSNLKLDVSENATAPAGGKFALGDRVTKTKGSKWTGRVVGFYSTKLTPIGYAVESETETGSVQIYPEAALAALPGDAGEQP
jgi:hypothetical protein